jgi:N-acetylglutamate synthase-like GNAT family acetyltransferase
VAPVELQIRRKLLFALSAERNWEQVNNKVKTAIKLKKKIRTIKRRRIKKRIYILTLEKTMTGYFLKMGFKRVFGNLKLKFKRMAFPA